MEKDDGSNAQNWLLDIISDILNEDKSWHSINLDKFRKALSREYPQSFPYMQTGDAHTYLNFMHQAMKKIIKKGKKEYEWSVLNGDLSLTTSIDMKQNRYAEKI